MKVRLLMGIIYEPTGRERVFHEPFQPSPVERNHPTFLHQSHPVNITDSPQEA